jgi:hypothetical protein
MLCYGSAECSPKQVREDGCQLRSGRGGRAYTSSKSQPKADRRPSNFTHAESSWGAAPTIATLKVGGGSGAEPPIPASSHSRVVRPKRGLQAPSNSLQHSSTGRVLVAAVTGGFRL